MSARVSVILVREAAEQLTGSGCCGKLEGDMAGGARETPFRRSRREQQACGVLHRAVREFFPAGEVSVVTVDPRNQLYLVAKLARDVWHYRPGWKAAARTLSQSFRLPAVIVNGRVLGRGAVDPDTLCHAIDQQLGTIPARPSGLCPHR